MRIDPEHVEKLRAAVVEIPPNGDKRIDLDIPHLLVSMRRLSLWEGGLLMDSLMRAAQAKKLSKEQRVLLALFVPGTSSEEDEAPDAD